MGYAHILIFVFGTLVGSFLNVVILRHNTGESAFKGRSRCFSCKKILSWYELVPILSYLIQKGRCRNCGSKISIQYPLVEFVTGLLFLLAFNNFQSMEVELPYVWAIISLLIIIAVYDLRHQIIPDLFVWLFNLLTFCYLLFVIGYSLNHILSGFAFAVFFAFIWLISRGKWMGLGDAKLALGLGWMLGPVKTLSAFMFSFWLGGLCSIFLLLLGKGKYGMKSQIPLAPFLIAGSLLALFLNFEFCFYG